MFKKRKKNGMFTVKENIREDQKDGGGEEFIYYVHFMVIIRVVRGASCLLEARQPSVCLVVNPWWLLLAWVGERLLANP